ncbi:hypothetical protein TD95_004525 [Thielaviopsis punctulata]|uniref:Uncharacterized protein n=1 Tax=Thielaviopsis punctulata TaxID=72032 RepID=A0A0F4Z7N5_9PEZI|nr:hypothetical protein TD95_004525 [Thielaviopsis punctulata]
MFAMNLGAVLNVRTRPSLKRSKVPEPTPVSFPPPPTLPASTEPNRKNFVTKLQNLSRPTDIDASIFADLGLETKYNVPIEEVIPDSSYLPDFEAWDKLSRDEAIDLDKTIRKKMPSGHFGPGAVAYLDRKMELSHPNASAYRVVRRLEPLPGQSQLRLGNAYDFWRNLETFTLYWDDTTEEPVALDSEEEDSSATQETGPGGEEPGKECLDIATDDKDYYRTMTGSELPNEFRHSLTTAFIKLIAYDFGSNTSVTHTQPRLHLHGPPRADGKAPRRSHFPSMCTWVFRTPTQRAEARAGIVEGPVAAVSARETVNFQTELDVNLDLAREVIACLIAAQHRSRDGKPEKRFGDGKWWTKNKRWGGGPGGPIGREIDPNDIPGDKEAAPQKPQKEEPAPPPKLKFPAMPPMKRAKKTAVNIYEQYRKMLPPPSSWDPKTKYQAFGRVAGADYDDVFLVSSLFHHISIVRMRVPQALVDILDGEVEGSDYDKLPMWRSKWYDMFVFEDRMEALRLMWGVMAYQLRDTFQDV